MLAAYDDRRLHFNELTGLVTLEHDNDAQKLFWAQPDLFGLLLTQNSAGYQLYTNEGAEVLEVAGTSADFFQTAPQPLWLGFNPDTGSSFTGCFQGGILDPANWCVGCWR